MKLNTDQVELLKGMFLMRAEHEFNNTKKVIAAIPEDKTDYRPDPKSKTAFELSWHIANSEIWFLKGVSELTFGDGGGNTPAEVKTIANIITWYEKNFHSEVEKIKAMSPQDLLTPVSFFNIFNFPAVMYLSLMGDHSIHHRGQLSVYLRPMGSKVPSIYGGSADEPFMPQ